MADLSLEEFQKLYGGADQDQQPPRMDLPKRKTDPYEAALGAAEDLKETGRNILPSAGRFAMNTVKGVADLAGGGVGMVLDPVATIPRAWEVAKKLPGAMMEHYGKRYGGLKQAADTIKEDPIGALADLSVVGSGVGAVAKLGALAKIPRAAQVAEAAAEFANATNPLTAIPAAMKPLRTKTAERLYQMELKPAPSSMPHADMKEMIRTGIREEIPVDDVGLGKTRQMIDEINSKVQGDVNTAAAAGATADPLQVTQALSRSKANALNQANPVDDMASVAAAEKEFLTEKAGMRPAIPGQPTGVLDQYGQPVMGAGTPAVPPQPIPLDEAQRIKQGTYRKLKDSAYKGEQKTAAVEAQKDLARGIKDEIYRQLPGLESLGKKEKILIELEEALDRFSNRMGNQMPIGISGPLTGGGVTAVTGSREVGLVAGMAAQFMQKYPGIMSRLAIRLGKPSRPMGRQFVTPVTVGNQSMREE